jgi:hypothetical protein
MSRHTCMPVRAQRTPYGSVSLSSRWKRDRYFLFAYGSLPSLQWMFPMAEHFEPVGEMVRHEFCPSPEAVTWNGT